MAGNDATFIAKLQNFLRWLDEEFPNSEGVRSYIDQYAPYVNNPMLSSIVVSAARIEMNSCRLHEGREEYINEWCQKANTGLTPQQRSKALLYLELFASLLF
jgi:hypothetical protein